MSCKCTNLYKFPNPVSGCDTAAFKALFTSLADGSYTIALEFLGSVQVVGITKAGTVITITTGLSLNESYTYQAQVLDSEGNVYPINSVYDCFQFSTANFSGSQSAPSSSCACLSAEELAFVQQLKANYES